MEINTLQYLSHAAMVETFNRAFSDYEINISYSEENFTKKVISENIIPEYSVGAFVNGELVAFILNGLDDVNGRKCVFNAGTGVVPEYRGQRIVQKLYDYILPTLKTKGYCHHQLEVLKGNDKAEKIYLNAGFVHDRNVSSFSGVVPPYLSENITLRVDPMIDWNHIKTFCDTEATWQNGFPAILRTIDHHEVIGAYVGNELAGFAVFDPIGGRLKHFGVRKDMRRRGIGRSLFAYVSGRVGKVTFTNYDMSDANALAFFNALQLEPGYELIEMRLRY